MRQTSARFFFTPWVVQFCSWNGFWWQRREDRKRGKERKRAMLPLGSPFQFIHTASCTSSGALIWAKFRCLARMSGDTSLQKQDLYLYRGSLGSRTYTISICGRSWPLLKSPNDQAGWFGKLVLWKGARPNFVRTGANSVPNRYRLSASTSKENFVSFALAKAKVLRLFRKSTITSALPQFAQTFWTRLPAIFIYRRTVSSLIERFSSPFSIHTCRCLSWLLHFSGTQVGQKTNPTHQNLAQAGTLGLVLAFDRTKPIGYPNQQTGSGREIKPLNPSEIEIEPL